MRNGRQSMRHPITGVIPAAGRGTRLFPLTYAIPKEMLPLGPRPTIQLVVEELVAAGVKDFVIVIGKCKGVIADHFASLRDELPAFAELNIKYVIQEEPRGLGDAVLCAADHVPGDLLVALGDAVIWGDVFGDLARRLLSVYEQSGASAVIGCQEVKLEDTSRYGIIKPGAAGPQGSIRALDLVEKPGPERAPSRLAVCARYVLSHQVFDLLRRIEPGHGGEVQLTDALQIMAREQHAYVVPLQADEERWDVGSLAGYGRTLQRAWQAMQAS